MSLTAKIMRSVPKRRFMTIRSASAVLLSGVLGLTACTRDYTVAYVYATASGGGSTGSINEYAVSYQSGALVPLSGSPVTTGSNPVAIATTSNGLFVYVINQNDSTVQLFAVGSGGELTSKGTYNTGTKPTALALDAANKFLYVTYTYQAGYSATNSGPGGVNIFPIGSDNTLGTPSNLNIGNNPVGIATTNFNSNVYVIDAESAVGSASPYGVLLAFSQNTSTGALTPVGRTTISTDASGRTVAAGYGAGTVPSSIAVDPRARFLYITDRSTNQMYGNLILSGGGIQAMVNSPFSVGLLPVAVTVESRGRYLYVANYNANTLGSYVIDQSTGALSATATSSSTEVGTGPSCITVEPALGVYVYTADNLSNTTTGLKLDSHNGTVAKTLNSPYVANGTPTCIASVANGAHATQVVNP